MGTSSITVDGIEFTYGTIDGTTGPGRFHVGKPDDLMADYLEVLHGIEGANVVELGIFRGGSAALAAVLGKPRKLVVVDIEGPVAELDRLIEQRGLGDVLRPYYGVDQADTAALTELAAEEFDGPIDLVIDDASHFLDPTRASFEALFPSLRPGGRYLVEDWHWELRFANGFAEANPAAVERALVAQAADEANPTRGFAAWALSRLRDEGDGGAAPTGYVPLARLALELAAVHAVCPGAVARVSVGGWWIEVERGPDPLPAPCSLRELGGWAYDLVAG